MAKHTILVMVMLFNIAILGCNNESKNAIQVEDDNQTTLSTAKESQSIAEEAGGNSETVLDISTALATLKNKSATAGEVEIAINSLVAHREEGLNSLWIEYLSNSLALYAKDHGNSENGNSAFHDRAQESFVAFKKDGLDFLWEQIREMWQDELEGNSHKKLMDTVKQSSFSTQDSIAIITHVSLWKDGLRIDCRGIVYRICHAIGKPELIEKFGKEAEQHAQKVDAKCHSK